MKTYQEFATEAYDRASGRPHRGTDYKGRDYGGSVEDHERAKRTAKAMASLQGGWLERERAAKKKVEEELEIEEGMSLKDYKKKRSALKQKEKRAADKIAPNRRKNIHTDRLSPERAARHRANVDPDFEGNDERNYPGGKLNNPKKIRKAKAMGELG